MRKFKLLTLSFCGIFLFACSSDNTEVEVTGELTKWIKEYYTYYNEETSSHGDTPFLQSRTEYLIEDNQITSYQKSLISNESTIITNTEISYDSNLRIASEVTSRNGQIELVLNYFYEDDKLSEWIINVISNGINYYTKIVYNYSQNNNIVKLITYYSTDGVNYTVDQGTMNNEKRFDNQNNQVYYQSMGNPSLNIYEYIYDTNNNLIQFENFICSYSNKLNTTSQLIKSTYGKKLFWLTLTGTTGIGDALSISEKTINSIEQQDNIIISDNTYSVNGILLSNKFIIYAFGEYPNNEYRNEFIYE